MSNKLKIYICSGVGDTESPIQFTTEGTSAASNTQAMNKLLSLINMCAADSQLLTASPEEKQECLRDMDIYSVCFYFARLYRNDRQKLMESGYAIARYIDDGRFNLYSVKLDEHGERVDSIIDGVQQLIDSEKYDQKEGLFIDWWKKEIVDGSVVGLSQSQIDAVENIEKKAAISGNDWRENGDLNKYLNDAGSYFLYTYLTPEQLKRLPFVFAVKRKKQLEVYEYCKQAFVPIYGTEADLQRVISTGIKNKFKETPEDVCNDIINGKTGIGIATEIIVAIISAVVTILTALIPVILNVCAAIAAEKYTVPEDPSAGIATEADFEDWEPKKNNTLLWIAGAAALALLLL